MKPTIHFVTRGRSNRGGHVVLTNIMRELLRRGFDVSLMSWYEEGTPLYPNCEELWEGLPIGIRKMQKGGTHEERFIIEQRVLREYLHGIDTQYDIIILDSWVVSLAAIHAGIAGCKNVFQLVQSEAHFQMEDSSKCWKAELFDLIAHVPLQRMGVSHSIVQSIATRYGQEIDYLPLFIDQTYHTSTFSPENQTPLRLMSSAATFEPFEKGLELLLASLDKVDNFAFELTLVTGKEITADLSKYQFPIQQKRAATPQEMVKIMQSHDAYISPSIKEAFGLAQAEAITLGMPVVAMDAIGNQDFIRGDNALLAISAENFVEKIQTLGDFDIRTSLHANAKKSMVEYQLGRTVDAFLEITLT